MQVGTDQWGSWASSVGAVLLSAMLALVGHALLYRVLGRIARRSTSVVDDALVRHTCGPTRVLLPLFAVSATIDTLPASSTALALLHHVVVIGAIVATAWTIVGLIDAAREIIEARYRIDVVNNLAARRIRTQVELIERIAVGVVAVVALAAVLMTFPSVRQLGVSLFASAGVAGIVLGVAARPVLGNLIAGIQIAMSQPIRIDDVVVLDGEFGRVEEINLTYVVLRLWDERRMIVPLAYFIEKPFTNWTRTRSSMLGTVDLYADYLVDVDALRAELNLVVRSTDLWDGRVANLQVNDVTDRALQLRAVVSAGNSAASGDLRALVRERLLAALRRQAEALPLVRAELLGRAEKGEAHERGARRAEPAPAPPPPASR
jgi:small-conductance mechanosensitive channel